MSERLLRGKPPDRGQKRKRGSCLICKEECDEDRSDYPLVSWDCMKVLGEKWKGLDRYGDLYDSVDWDKGPSGTFFHQSCRWTLASSRILKQSVNRKNKLLKTTETVNTETGAKTGRRSRHSSGPLHEKDRCIWCMKCGDDKHPKPGKLSLIMQNKSWEDFKEHACYLEDIEMKDRISRIIASISDPFAVEIRYHRDCWKFYMRPLYDLRLKASPLDAISELNTEAFREFTQHVQKVIFELEEPRTLQGLILDYKMISERFGKEQTTMKSSRMKQLLQRQFGDKIGFHERFHKNKSMIVYDTSAGGNYIESAMHAWGINDDQLLNIVARRLREQLQGETDISWPPTVEDLETEKEPNILLLKFLTWMTIPDCKDFSSPCKDPTVYAMSSLLNSLIARKRTSMITLLSVTIHGLTRSREIIDTLHRLSLGISYQDVLNLYSSWANIDVNSDCVCPSELAEGFPGTAVMDNDDFKDDTLTGAGTSHRTNMMFVQPETFSNVQKNVPSSDDLRLVTANDLKAITQEHHKVHPYKTTKLGIPGVQEKVDVSLKTTQNQRLHGTIHSLTRIQCDGSFVPPCDQTVGAFSGFHARIRGQTTSSKTFFYLTLPIWPSKSTVHEVMCRVLAAAEDKCMPMIQLVGDQPVYTLIKIENPQRFDVIVPVLGAFHAQMSFISAINKWFAGSGLAEVLVAADVIAAGSVEQALSGKNYKRGVRCLKLMYEALMRQLIKRASEHGISFPFDINDLLGVLRKPDEHLQQQLWDVYCEIEGNENLKTFVSKCFAFVAEMNSPMANYWLSFMQMVEILMLNMHALRTQNWPSFKDSLRMMLPWLKIYDNDKYGRWLQYFWLEMNRLSDERDKYMEDGLFAQSLTGKPYSCLPLDLCIEMTMNKGSKMKAGWARILKNEQQLMIHNANVNNINRLRSALQKIIDKTRFIQDHAENSKFRIEADGRAIQDLCGCFAEFECDPFDVLNTELRSLHSGIPASEKLQNDFETAHDDGEKLVQLFFKERLFSNEVPFDAVIHRNKRHNFSKPPAEKETLRSEKSDAMENKAMCAVVALAERNSDQFKLTTVMEHRITDECLSIFNVDGTMRKVQKSKLFECLNLVEKSVDAGYIAIVDMGFIWRLAIPTSEDRESYDDRVFTWGEYAKRIYSLIRARHPKAHTIIMTNDPYDIDSNIKDSEHPKRYASVTKNVFFKASNGVPSPKEFSDIFKNSKNKVRLQDFLKDIFHELVLQEGSVKLYYSVRDKCWDLSSQEKDTKKHEYECLHLEADTIIFFIYNQIRKEKVEDIVVIDAEDTYVVVLSAFVAHNLKGSLYLKRKSKFYDCAKLCDRSMAEVLIEFHIFSGGDSTAGFFGHGKKSLFDSVNRKQGAKQMLGMLGKEVPVSESTITNLIMFTIRYVYKDEKSKSLGEARALKWTSMKKKSTSRIPPDCDSLKFKIARANYQVYFKKKIFQI